MKKGKTTYNKTQLLKIIVIIEVTFPDAGTHAPLIRPIVNVDQVLVKLVRDTVVSHPMKLVRKRMAGMWSASMDHGTQCHHLAAIIQTGAVLSRIIQTI